MVPNFGWYISYLLGFPKMGGTPIAGWYIIEHSIKMDDFGVPATGSFGEHWSFGELLWDVLVATLKSSFGEQLWGATLRLCSSIDGQLP